jgi:glycosyltransferase involved in cell wall biosynthesis
MRIAYLYNEILPTRKAHDAYVWHNCVALAQAGCDVALACGRGSPAAAALAAHYGSELPQRFRIERLPILRRNFGLPVSWGAVFNAAAQRYLAADRPDAAVLSVRKQGAHHLARKVPGVRYVYEVHDLAWYPTLGAQAALRPEVAAEREMLARADLVTVTTGALRAILMEPPYSLDVAPVLVPLAIAPPPEPPHATHALPLHAMYLGQLYPAQGVQDLLKAVERLDQVRLTIVGGSSEDEKRLRETLAPQAAARVTFTGFVAPAELPRLAAAAHVLVAPFHGDGRMPFVAHTKLDEYIALRRPVVAPDLPIVREHFPGGRGLRSYAADDVQALAGALAALLDAGAWQRACREIHELPIPTWSSRSQAYAALLRSTLGKA